MILNGSEIVVGGNIIMPIALVMLLMMISKTKNGIEFMKFVETVCKKLVSDLSRDRKELSKVIRQLKKIAEADNKISNQEQLVMQAAIGNLGFSRKLKMKVSENTFVLKKV